MSVRSAILLLVLLPLGLVAQTREELGSSYLAYPTRTQQAGMPADLQPVYLSHYGRHGSRWLTEDARYEKVLQELDTHELTPYGKDIRQRLEIVWQDARGRSGDLTRVGERQHHDIARRMVANFPQLFQDADLIIAQSSTSRRCMMSMMAACEGIKEVRPAITIQRSAHERDMDTINHESEALQAFKKGESWKTTEQALYQKQAHYQRIMSRLFVTPSEIADPIGLFDGLYWIASDMQNVELGQLSFYDLFTYEELQEYWKAINYRMYVTNGPSSLNQGIMAESSENLLQAIVQDADRALHDRKASVHLRFGHDSALLRLLTRMGIMECQAPQEGGKLLNDQDVDIVARYWQDYRLVPMAANLQLVFYRDANSRIHVRFLLNEEPAHLPLAESLPALYDWEEVKNLWNKQ